MGEIHPRISCRASKLPSQLAVSRRPSIPGIPSERTQGRSRWFNKNVKYKVAGGDGRLGNK